jgi:hypothetical protein
MTNLPVKPYFIGCFWDKRPDTSCLAEKTEMSSEPPSSSQTWHLPKSYNDQNFWIRGNKATRGPQNPQVIYLGVGHALSNWEHVEAAAAMFFSAFVESRTIAGIRAYGTINGSRAREAALRQVAETFFSLRKLQHQKDRATHDMIKKAEKIAGRLIHNYGQRRCLRRAHHLGGGYCLTLKDGGLAEPTLRLVGAETSEARSWVARMSVANSRRVRGFVYR